MKKVLVVYESKYGNTRLVAETIAKAMGNPADFEMVTGEVGKVARNDMAGYDAILIGTPNHMGGPTREIRKFIDFLGKASLKNKNFAVFDTYIAKDCGKAVEKMEKRLKEKVAGARILLPGLSVLVGGMKGPVSEKELARCREFGSNAAKQIAAN